MYLLVLEIVKKVDVVKLARKRQDGAKDTNQESSEDLDLNVKWDRVRLDGLVLRHESPV